MCSILHTAAESGNYSSAITKFEEAKTLFQSINNEKEEECSFFIQECKNKVKSEGDAEKAELLLNEGITYFRRQQYTMAKARFEQALNMFTALQNEDKTKECEQWISACEEHPESEESTPINVRIIGGAVGIVFVVVVVLVFWKVKHKSMHKLEKERKKLSDMLSKGLISQKEYDIAEKEIKENLRRSSEK